MNSAPDITQPAPGAADRLPARLRGFGPIGILAIVVIFAGITIGPPIAALLVLVWARWSRTPWQDLGFVRPTSWLATIGLGIAFGVAFKFLMKSIVMPLLGAPAVNPAYHHLAGDLPGVLGLLPLLIIGAGFGEEVFFRGYLFERLGRLLGRKPVAQATIVLLTAGLFGIAHWHDQGLAGSLQGGIVGLVFGTIFAITRRLWLLVLTHAAFDVTALAMIYWDVEAQVAHFFFSGPT